MPQKINVKILIITCFLAGFSVLHAGDPPFGVFSTPLNGSTISGNEPVTGWALDDVGIQSLKIYRNAYAGEGGGLVYLGDAAFIEGARPDIEVAYPDFPNNSSAGWGYMLQTYFLQDGALTLHAIVTDTEGYQVTLDTKTFTVDNANNVKPFGNIDAPSQGGTASGSSYVIWGWTLTPQPNTIPTDGSTINIWVDGVSLGNPDAYNIYRNDIATLFPGYNNSNGAVFYMYLNTTLYSNGLHTISVTVTDDANNTDSIASHYFIIENDNPLPVTVSAFQANAVDDHICLTWVTESELDNLGFVVEKLCEKSDWSMIASFETDDHLKSKGQSTSRSEYSCQDFDVVFGEHYSYRLSFVNTKGNIKSYPPIFVDYNRLPTQPVLEPAYPNPFNPQTTISYYIPQSTHVLINIFDRSGRKIKILINQKCPVGYHNLTWDGVNESGQRVSSGVYMVSMFVGDKVSTQKIVLLK